MSKKEEFDLNEMFQDLEEMFQDPPSLDDGEVIIKQVSDLHDAEDEASAAEFDFDAKGIVDQNVIPLISQIYDICTDKNIPIQLAVVAGRREGQMNIVRMITNERECQYIFAGHHVYDLPHGMAHFVTFTAQLISAHGLPVITKSEDELKTFSVVAEYENEVVPLLKTLYSYCQDNNIPLQWSATIASNPNEMVSGGGITNNRKVGNCQMGAAFSTRSLPTFMISDLLDIYETYHTE